MEKKSKKISVPQIIAFGISFGIAFFVANYFFSRNTDTPNGMLIEVSKQMNKSMPKMMDAETRLDSTSVQNETLNYHYTLINISDENKYIDFDTVKEQMKAKAQDNLATNPVMEEYRKNNISLHYIFKDKNSKPVFDYTVNYQNKK